MDIVVSRAFQVLSDPEKKQKYDKFGQDPDSRFQSNPAAQGASPFSGGFRSPGPRGPMFEEEISPEELFRQFFGGGFGGGGFGGGRSTQTYAPMFKANMYIRLRHRTRLCFQPWWRPRSACSPVWRRQTKKKTNWRRNTSIRILNPYLPSSTNSPLHLPPSLISLFGINTIRTKHALRNASITAHAKAHIRELESTLLRKPHRSSRLLEKSMGLIRSNGRE